MIKAEVMENGIITVGTTTVSDSVEFVKIKFAFPDSWLFLTKTAVFSHGDTTVRVILNTEGGLCTGINECYIPHEVLKSPAFNLYVFGVNGDTRATTTRVPVLVLKSGYALGDAPTEPTPSEYAQLIDISNQTKAIANEIKERADKGEFKGEKGDTGPAGRDGYTPTVDNNFSPTSYNPQSGYAVNQAIKNAGFLSLPKDFEGIQKFVRSGLASIYIPIGYEFKTYDSNNEQDIIWRVVGHDRHTPADPSLTHSMTLESKYAYSNKSGSGIELKPDGAEAFYTSESGLSAGTYYFTASTACGYYANDGGKSFSFTLTKDVPIGGQLCLSSISSSNSLLQIKIVSYASPTSFEIIEETTISEGAIGTYLGTAVKDGNFNYKERALLGSGNYAQSALRQWLNSDKPKGEYWIPQHKFDRPPTWHTEMNGFMSGLPKDFLNAVAKAKLPMRTNLIYEVDSSDGTDFEKSMKYDIEDYFFLLSQPEIFGTYNAGNIPDGELLEYYNGLTASEISKSSPSGYRVYTWMRTPSAYSVSQLQFNCKGAVASSAVSNLNGIAPACIIA